MALTLTYKGIVQESTEQGINTQVTMIGTLEECRQIFDTADYGAKHPQYGYLRQLQLQQGSGKFYTLIYKYSTASNAGSTPPESDIAYGKKSATLNCGLMALPLPTHEDYVLNWDHYLFAPPGTSTPAFWETAKTTKNTPQPFRWGKNLSDSPDGMVVIEEPTMPGVTHRDVSTYQLTETVKCRTDKAAGHVVANKLNKIIDPEYTTFDITEGDWKCESVTVSWRNKAWYATLTYTRSGDDKGWNKKLYNK